MHIYLFWVAVINLVPVRVLASLVFVYLQCRRLNCVHLRQVFYHQTTLQPPSLAFYSTVGRLPFVMCLPLLGEVFLVPRAQLILLFSVPAPRWWHLLGEVLSVFVPIPGPMPHTQLLGDCHISNCLMLTEVHVVRAISDTYLAAGPWGFSRQPGRHSPAFLELAF